MFNDLDLSLVRHVYIKPGRTDLRKGIEGLAAIIRADMHLDPIDGSLFLFCGTRSDRLKGLLYEGDGFLLLYKRVSDGRFHWPRTSDEARELSPESYQQLMRGLEIDPGIRPFKPREF